MRESKAQLQMRQQLLDLKRQRFQTLARSNLLDFTLYTWANQTKRYDVNWHHALTCRQIDRWLRGEIKFLMIREPPGHGKSELTSRRLPALIHGLHPDDEIMAASYSLSLANEMTADVQGIMDSDPYHELFPETRIPTMGTMDKEHPRNSEEHCVIDRLGVYRGQGVGGSFTGKRGRWLLIDDPIKGREVADSVAFREHLWNWYTNDFRTRGAMGGCSILLTLTTWHEDGLDGRLIKLMKQNLHADQWAVLDLPAFRIDTSNPDDPRTGTGECPEAVLWPSAYPMEALLAIKAGDTRGFSALFQQRPVAPGGSRFEPGWWVRHKEVPIDRLRKAMFIDCAAKKLNPLKKHKPDFTAMACWTETTTKYYLEDIWRKRCEFPEQVRAVKDMFYAQKPDAIVIEDASNGIALGQHLLSETTLPVIMYPCENKEVRAQRSEPTVKAGRCSLPEEHPGMGDFISEHQLFPFGENDDMVDTTSIMIDYFRNDAPVPSIRLL